MILEIVSSGENNFKETKVLKDLSLMEGSRGQMNYFQFAKMSGVILGLSINNHKENKIYAPFFFRVRIMLDKEKVDIGEVADVLQNLSEEVITSVEMREKFNLLRLSSTRVSFVVPANQHLSSFSLNLPIAQLRAKVMAELTDMMNQVVIGLQVLGLPLTDVAKRILLAIKEDIYKLSFDAITQDNPEEPITEAEAPASNVVPFNATEAPESHSVD
jgi:hypothetical protein